MVIILYIPKYLSAALIRSSHHRASFGGVDCLTSCAPMALSPNEARVGYTTQNRYNSFSSIESMDVEAARSSLFAESLALSRSRAGNRCRMEKSKLTSGFEGKEPEPTGAELQPIRGGRAKLAENMNASLQVPTATSYRSIPVKLLEENRRILNDHLQRSGRAKLSFTHLVGWAMVCALREYPGFRTSFASVDGTYHRRIAPHIHLGVAVDIARRDGSRNLLVPSIKGVGTMNFTHFWQAYDDVVVRARTGQLEPSDFEETTITLTNPGTVGTVSSLPRLMVGQSAIVAIGAIQYPAEYHAWSDRALSRAGLSKVMEVSCTYDHRIIQGAESGRFLERMHNLLLGEEGFYGRIFEDLKIPDRPVIWAMDVPVGSPVVRAPDPQKQAGVLQLINLYRVRGHLIANLDPLGKQTPYHPELDASSYGLTLWDLDREFVTGGIGGLPQATLREILQVLRQAYCQKIGVEYRHIQDPDEKLWIQERMEPPEVRTPFPHARKRQILTQLVTAELFEQFLHKRFIGHKRYGLEGAETLIPAIAEILRAAVTSKVDEAVIGMAHRGRLNILSNIIGKPLVKVLSEFEDVEDPLATQGSGDVKYHLGASGWFDSGGRILVSVVPNPSHLEWVNPVVEGIVRAKQERRGDRKREKVIPVLIHGDAAFAGQGVVYETLNLSQLRGYRTGGTVHIIINNQIGFTTPPEDARSSPYATDVAKSVQAPILHVNGDDPESAVRVSRLAFDYRQRFKKDVVIDLFCYRRHGHNEADEPSYTQPFLYRKIRQQPSVLSLYSEQLKKEGSLRHAELEAISGAYQRELDLAFQETQTGEHHFVPDVPLAVSEEELMEFQPTGGTQVDLELLQSVADSLTTLPAGFQIHPKLAPFLAKRRASITKKGPVDWSFAEALAFGTLLCEGTPVRLSGQDSVRGTFSQRHLLLTDVENETVYIPMSHLQADQASFEAVDSSLSEAAVLGFEFGYSVADPLALVVWEAQFGDFANVAQATIDNFIATSETKWQQPCDLVLLLPHGFEGQGPEHSSARLERFLILCAENNMRVCCPTTAKQHFHVLRQQMRDAKRIPLVLLSPKSLLRHPGVASTLAELAEGSFEPVLDDPAVSEKAAIRRVVLCSGKVYYDLHTGRMKAGSDQVALVRLERLYPFPERQLRDTLASYRAAQEFYFVQEEPGNMGPWPFLRHRLPQELSFRCLSRDESASPASGSAKTHREEQAALVRSAVLEEQS